MAGKTKFLIIGRTSVGKSTIAGALCRKLGLKQVKSYTTRPPRNEAEEKGISDHIFISDEQFDRIPEEETAAYTKIGDVRYCTTFSVLDECDVYVIDPEGVRGLKEKSAGRYILKEIYITAPAGEAAKRFAARGKGDYSGRAASEDSQFNAYEQAAGWDKKIVNADICESIAEAVAFALRCMSEEQSGTPAERA